MKTQKSRSWWDVAHIDWPVMFQWVFQTTDVIERLDKWYYGYVSPARPLNTKEISEIMMY